MIQRLLPAGRRTLLLVGLLLGAGPAGADPYDRPATYPQGVPKILDGTVLKGQQVVEYRPLVLPELYPLVRSGKLPLPVQSSLQLPWKFDEDWEEKSLPASQEILPLKETIRLGRGFPFGREPRGKPEVLAEKLLWNLNAHVWAQRVVRSEFRLLWFLEDRVARGVKGTLERMYPKALQKSDERSRQLFREKITFSDPPPIAGLTWLTFRFFGEQEDTLWIYSPAIGKVRQLVGSNRTDPILGSSVTPEDLMTWSGKVEDSNAVVTQRMTALVPFLPSVKMAPVSDPTSGCVETERPTEPSVIREPGGTGRWNFETKRWLDAAGWAPTGTTWIPRDVAQLRILTDDYYAAYSRQLLYLDMETMLPVYKVVFDRAGNLAKVLISAYSYGVESKRRVPVPAYTIVLEMQGKRSFIVDYQRTRYCEGAEPLGGLSAFDPNHIAPATQPKPTETPPRETPTKGAERKGGGSKASQETTLPKPDRTPDTEAPGQPLPSGSSVEEPED